jgi:hypothetical protein
MFYIALGTVLDDVEKAQCWAGFVETAETKEEEQRYRRNALKYKAKSIVEFDRVMDRLVKEYK